MSSSTLELTDSIYDYLLANITPESETAAALKRITRAEIPMHVMQISSEQGAFMAMLVRLINAKKTIEIGTFTGYSALVVAEALPPEGKVIACDVSESWTNIAKEYWERGGVSQKIDLHLRPGTETINELIDAGESGTYDFAFIDADKPNYDLYYEGCLTLLRPGGVLGIDNVLWGGRTADPTVQDESTVALRTLNTKVVADDRVTSTMLPIGDGFTLVMKKN